MIFWIASYPKSGNTWLRALICAYYYSENGIFNDELLKKIDQFPTRKYFKEFRYDKNIVGDTCKFWIRAQEEINRAKEIKFFKTHNVFGKVNNFDFTNIQNSLGGLYIVRDPRNVITSIKNHYELNDEKALNWMKNEKNFLYDVEKFDDVGFSDFQFISSWKTNYNSWKTQKKIPMKFIKYEDLVNQTYIVFLDVIKYINNITQNNKKISKEKIKKVLRSTSFENLKKNEVENGFSESVTTKADKNKKISFFHLGPKNDWKKFLNRELKIKIEKTFEKDLKELSYL